MKKVDAREVECPMPVIMAKRVINEGEEEFSVLVAEQIAVDNLNKMADQMNYKTSVEEKSQNEFEVKFVKSKSESNKKESSENYIVVFDADKIGEGEENFSKKLIESFIVALTEQENYPDYVICYNKGVYLTTERENTVNDFKKLEEGGVKILSCGLCLDNYNLKDKLKVGSITNMYEIVGLMSTHKVVRP